MADYRRLLYSIGGGIIDGARREEQNGSATIVIGLGGTGKDAIKHLKKEICQRVMPDNPGDVVPKYRHIRYLCIDSDQLDLWNDTDLVGIDEESEFFSIMGKPLVAAPFAKWLSPGCVLSSLRNTNGVRQIGRYFLLSRSKGLLYKLQTILVNAAQNLGTPKRVNIHVITGLGGGTGSGCFLDLCYILRHAVVTCHALAQTEVFVGGYFFLPDVSLEKVLMGSVQDYIMYNSFAAMKELDYCMDLEENSGRFEQEYDDFSVSTTRQPVDIAYLISAQTLSRNMVSNGYNYALGAVSDWIVNFLCEDGISMADIIFRHNLFVRNLRKQYGACYKYAILGAAHSRLFVRETVTYLASGLFEHIEKAWSTEPSDADIEAFMEGLGMTVEKLKMDIGGFFIRIPEVDNVFPRLPEDDAGEKNGYGYVVLPEPFSNPFRREEQIANLTLARGYDELIVDWADGTDPDDSPKSIVCRIYKGLKEILRDPKKGPIYAAKMLFGSNQRNIINFLSDLHRTASACKDEAYNNIGLRVKAVKEAKYAYNHRGIFGSRTNLFTKYLMAVQADVAQRCEYERLRLLCGALEVAKEQLLRMYHVLFGKYVGVITDLFRVFKENKIAITALQDRDITDPVTVPLFKIDDLRKILDNVIAGLDIERETVRFQDAFFEDAHEIWWFGNEDEIGKWISDYMLNAFRPYIELSLDDYMRRLYPQYSVPGMTSALTEQVKEDVIEKLGETATELFMPEGARAPRMAEHLDSIAYCSAPFSAPVVNAAIDAYRERHDDVTRRGIKGEDGIYFLRHTSGVPLCAYRLIDQCYEVYQGASAVAGKHLYEGTEGDPRNWQYLSDLRPCSIYRQIDWATLEKEEILAAYDKAEGEYGIIRPCPSEYGVGTEKYIIVRTPDCWQKVQAVRERIKPAKMLADAEVSWGGAEEMLQKVNDALAALQREKDDLQTYWEEQIAYRVACGTAAGQGCPEIEPLPIRNDGGENPEEAFSVRRDRVLSDLKRTQAVLEEVKKEELSRAAIADADAAVRALETKADALREMIRRKEQALPEFLDGLLSGVIVHRKGQHIFFEDKDESGIENSPTVELSKPADKPFGASAPLYQAFNTFCALPEETREKIRAKIARRLNGVDENGNPKDWSAEMRTACGQLDTIFTVEYVQIILLMNKGCADYADIVHIYDAYSTAREDFRAARGI